VRISTTIAASGLRLLARLDHTAQHIVQERQIQAASG